MDQYYPRSGFFFERLNISVAIVFFIHERRGYILIKDNEFERFQLRSEISNVSAATKLNIG